MDEGCAGSSTPRAAGAGFVPPSGLGEREAQALLEGYGDLRESAPRSSPVRTWDRVRRESVFTVFNLNLLGLAFVQLLLRDWWGAGVTVFMLFLTTGIRLLQERLAGRRVQAFLSGASPLYTVVRDGKARSVDPDAVVPGDVLVVGHGDQVLVDGVFLGPEEIVVDASLATGERGRHRVTPGQRVHGGSFCVGGHGFYESGQLGMQRRVAARAASFAAANIMATPLERLVARILQGLLLVVLAYAVLLLAAWFRLDLGAPADAFIDAAPVIFSLAPSGLYLMIIVTYATGTADLAQGGVLVRSARSVESLAETTVLCFTEIGILTGTSAELTPIDNELGVSESRLRQILGDAARSTQTGGPLVEALAESFEGEVRAVRDETGQMATLGWAAVEFDDPDVEGVFVLGERRVIEPQLTSPLPDHVDDDSRTLVFAYRPEAVSLRDSHGRAALPDALVALATVQVSHKLRADAMDVVRGFVDAGVRVKAFGAQPPEDIIQMLRSAGIAPEDLDYIVSRGVISGGQLARHPESQWGEVASNHALYGGLTPLQVGDVVRALRDRGETVAVVGDGVRDLPALQEASVAVAQRSSTQATLGLADIVLLDNSPAALLKALGRGQSIVRSLLDVLKLNLTMVLASALLIVDVRLISTGFPYVSSQGSLIGILAVTVPSFVLSVAISSKHHAISHRAYPRTLIRFVLPAGVLLSLAAFGVYLWVLRTSGLVSVAQLAVTWTLLYAGLLAGWLTRRNAVQAKLAALLVVVATALPLIPSARRQFRLSHLPEITDYVPVVVAVVGWLLMLLLVWKGLRRAGRNP